MSHGVLRRLPFLSGRVGLEFRPSYPGWILSWGFSPFPSGYSAVVNLLEPEFYI